MYTLKAAVVSVLLLTSYHITAWLWKGPLAEINHSTLQLLSLVLESFKEAM